MLLCVTSVYLEDVNETHSVFPSRDKKEMKWEEKENIKQNIKRQKKSDRQDERNDKMK